MDGSRTQDSELRKNRATHNHDSQPHHRRMGPARQGWRRL